ncbi:endonuclease/exonuclease/phosphatase family metal-dependent hydrolase [Rhizobium halophytocola]|uniref:Endonuclease/exonuclease/phosphatase family metal-dependent hydrolase n=1 Tax=Rhizobium halophytocola TaxID=735519 RepID=A0ABS4E312_9HYPH|nr:endonuclease/exonuclease/phosphatase family metal-dependent hydrolase [Rhizobium halophytocola]
MTRRHTLTRNVLTSIRNQRSRPLDSPDHRGGGDSLLVASYNVHKCVGSDGRFDPARIMDVICEIAPDVIALQEADERFGERAGLLDLHRLKEETGLMPVPIETQPKSHGYHGNLLLFRQGAVHDVHQLKLPGLEPRGAVIAEIEMERGGALRVIASHFGLMRWARRQQADRILDLLGSRDDRPTIMMGDFNEWRLGNGSALRKLEKLFGPLPAPVPSFPARMPMLSLDRIIANRSGLIDGILVHDTPLARLASDHLPITARVELGTPAIEG